MNGTEVTQRRKRTRAKWLAAVAILLVLIVGLAAAFYFRPIEMARNMTRAALRLSGVESHYVVLGGYRVHYNEAGPKTGRRWC